MFSIKHIQDKNNSIRYLELIDQDSSSYAKIDLNLGGSLQELILSKKDIISGENNLPYENSYSSSILFPFVNRIENGSYNFNHKTFKLHKNESNGHNAIHGLVHDKTFQLIEQEISDKNASVVISYTEINPDLGFPFKYSISLKYVLSKEALKLNVDIENKDQHAFPFGLGWHPYFKTNDLYNSQLKINSSKQILVNEKMIPNGEADIHWVTPIKIEDKIFDDCFILNNNEVELKTPEYHLNFNFFSDENYLQIFTPHHRKSIAIEPQTAPANSFNTKMGLRILNPNEIFNISWKIQLK